MIKKTQLSPAIYLFIFKLYSQTNDFFSIDVINSFIQSLIILNKNNSCKLFHSVPETSLTTINYSIAAYNYIFTTYMIKLFHV